MAFSSDNLPLFELIRTGSTVVVTNKQSATNLNNQYGHWLSSKGVNSWQTPLILPWQIWIDHCWQDYARVHNDPRIVLSRLQQRLVWRELIHTDIQNQAETVLWDIDASVSQAITAWKIVHDYHLDPSRWLNHGCDSAVFVRWYDEYISILKTNRWLDPAQLTSIMIMKGFVPDAQKLVLFNCSQLTPIQLQWINHLQSSSLELNVTSKTVSKIANINTNVNVYLDLEQEITASALWVRNLLCKKSNTTVGIVVPELKQKLPLVETIYRSVFVPEFCLNNDETDVFEFSTSQSMTESGLVQSALNCLELLQNNFDYQTFSLLMRNVYLKDNSLWRNQISLWDIHLRNIAQSDQTLCKILPLIKNQNGFELPCIDEFISTLERFVTFRQSLDQYASPAQWCTIFSRALSILGWPDIKNLNSSERSEIKQWDHILSLMCTSGLIKKSITVSQALSLLNDCCISTQYPVNGLARVKIMDLSDAIETQFDALWLSGLTDSVLPENTRLNPLIPFSLQRKHNMPSANVESCLDQAKQRFSHLINSADDINLSYFKTDEQKQYRVSPLIISLNQIVHEHPDNPGFASTQCIELESFTDDYGLVIKNNDVSGGAYLLKAQAACPFQAYAQFRLKANSLQQVEPGLDAAQKGGMAHEILLSVWRQISNQKALLELNEQDLSSLITKHIELVVSGLDPVYKIFSEVEKQRLFEMITTWLKIESKRSLGFKVLHQEYKTRIIVDLVELQLKIDRIDELANGDQLIIDYKTGYAESKDWLGERLADPQLPIYAMALKSNTAGVTFANLKGLVFDGVSRNDTQIQGLRIVSENNRGRLKQFKDWDELMSHWEAGIKSLAIEYRQGLARVTPVNPNQHCQYCARQVLCRVYDQQEND